MEGKRILLPAKGHLQDTLTEMEQDLQSAISYAGGRQVADLKHVDYVIVKNSIWNGMLPTKTGSLTKKLVIRANFCYNKTSFHP